MRTAAQASVRARGSARSAVPGRPGRRRRDTGGAAPCRSYRGSSGRAVHVLGEGDPGLSVALAELDAVGHSLEYAAEADASGLGPELVRERGRDRADLGLDRPLANADAERDVPVPVVLREQGVEPELEILEVLERQVQTAAEATQDKMGDAVERGLARNGEDDLVHAGHRSCARQRRMIPEPTTASSS